MISSSFVSSCSSYLVTAGHILAVVAIVEAETVVVVEVVHILAAEAVHILDTVEDMAAHILVVGKVGIADILDTVDKELEGIADMDIAGIGLEDIVDTDLVEDIHKDTVQAVEVVEKVPDFVEVDFAVNFGHFEAVETEVPGFEGQLVALVSAVLVELAFALLEPVVKEVDFAEPGFVGIEVVEELELGFVVEELVGTEEVAVSYTHLTLPTM